MRSDLVVIATAVALAVVIALATAQPTTHTPLTDYVYHPDRRHYRWNVSSSVIKGPGYSAYNVYMQSQQWLTAAESDSSIWLHWLQVCIPDDILPDAEHAFLYIDGGSTPRDPNNPPTDIEFVITKLCRGSKTIGAVLHQIPNQPIYFTGDPTRGRSEDAMIAYTWSHFVNNTLEPDWLARMPMTKASIRAIDTVQNFIQSLGTVKVPTKFVVGGASKRGWTSWMVGAMGDPRVVGIVPIVAPIANLIPQINEMWQSYGNWSFALKDYLEMGLMGFLNLPVFKELLHIIDPLTYLPEMARIPKYVIVAAGDEFFMPDSAQYYWPQLTGEKHLRIVPNAEHSMAGHIISVLNGVQEFYVSLMNEDITRPTYSWTISQDGGTITLTTSTTKGLLSAKVWMSNNTEARDWRLITCAEKSPKCANPVFFRSLNLTETAPGVFSYTHAMPAVGWSAFFIELEYALNGDDLFMTVTSDMSIIPKKMPYPPCGIDVCYCGYKCPPNNGAPPASFNIPTDSTDERLRKQHD